MKNGHAYRVDDAFGRELLARGARNRAARSVGSLPVAETRPLAVLERPKKSENDRAIEKAKREALERQFLLQLRTTDLPQTHRQQWRFHQTRNWRFDFAWPELQIAIEIDGAVHTNGRHNRGAGFEEDMLKLNEASLLGWTVLRFSGGMVKDGTAIQFVDKFFAEVVAVDKLSTRGAHD